MFDDQSHEGQETTSCDRVTNRMRQALYKACHAFELVGLEVESFCCLNDFYVFVIDLYCNR